MRFGRKAPEFQVKNRLYQGGNLRSQAALAASGLKPDDAVQELDLRAQKPPGSLGFSPDSNTVNVYCPSRVKRLKSTVSWR